MINTSQLKPSTVEAFKKIYTDKREALDYMSKFGTAFEKAIADMIISTGGTK